ncbi:MAG: hypothetical protein HKN22_07900 [Bacteroidia bacterium]|nr:hypothetical protein [Bacteroidia bacterium]
MNYQSAEIQKKEQDSKKVIVIVVITILLAVNGLLLWQFFDKKSNLEAVTKSLNTAMSEKDALSAELQRMKREYEKVNQENAGLQTQLSAKDEEIKSKIAQIQRLINSGDAAQLRRARLELTELRTLKDTYSHKIDSINKVNLALNNENLNLNKSLETERIKISGLENTNSVLASKVAIGSILQASDVSSSGVKYKSNGREIESARASKCQKIRTCLTVLENRVTNPGTKLLYVRVLSPDGAVLSTSSETFDYNGVPTLFTYKEAFDYNNESLDMCSYWSKGSQYSKGKYVIELYVDGSQIGVTSFALK